MFKKLALKVAQKMCQKYSNVTLSIVGCTKIFAITIIGVQTFQKHVQTGAKPYIYFFFQIRNLNLVFKEKANLPLLGLFVQTDIWYKNG